MSRSPRRFLASTLAALLLAGCGGAPRGLSPVARGAAPSAARFTSAGADLEAASGLAAATLKKNTREVGIAGEEGKRRVIRAGGTHFDALWARDAMFASLGALEAGQTEVVRDSISSLLRHQRADGLAPRRLGGGSNLVSVVRKGIGLSEKPASSYQAVDFVKESVDTNAMLAWVSAEYVAKTGDAAFRDAQLPALRKGMAYLGNLAPSGLITQRPFTDWKDMLGREGQVLYTNVVYYQGLRALQRLCKEAGDEGASADYARQAEALAQRIRSTFWDERLGHFQDTTKLAAFSPDGNLLAIVAGIATPAQAARVFAKVDGLLAKEPLLLSAEKAYPSAMVPTYMFGLGIQHYGDTMQWPWLTSLLSWAASTAGDGARARGALERVAAQALREKTFLEISEGPEARAVKRPLYQSEIDFSWSAGMYLKAKAALR